MEHTELGNLVHRIVKNCLEIEDQKVKGHFWTQIVEEILTRLPYTKHLALLLLEDHAQLANGGGTDLLFLARECLK